MIQKSKGIFVFALSMAIIIRTTRAMQPMQLPQDSIASTEELIKTLQEQLTRQKNSLEVEFAASDTEDKLNRCLFHTAKSVLFVKTHLAEFNNPETQANTLDQFHKMVQDVPALITTLNESTPNESWLFLTYIRTLKEDLRSLQQYLVPAVFDALHRILNT